MVVMDATVLLHLFHPNVSAALDPASGLPVDRCRDRVDLLVQNLSKAGIHIVVPTPVLSEVLVVSGPDVARILSEINNTYAFHVEPFDERAAIEVAMLTRAEAASKNTVNDETKAKVKYDRQIIAIAKVNGIKTIYSDDRKLAAKAAAHGISVVGIGNLPLPAEPPQAELPFVPSTGE